MAEIYDTHDDFDFSKIALSSPVSAGNGNFFIQFSVNNTRLYIQPPKCSTKQGILKSGKKLYTDLVFTQENESFIRWMENLESYCQKTIYTNRNQWFEGDMEMDDIENYFTTIMKIYRSGKYYSVRANIATGLGKPLLKIYDEHGKDVEFENITDKTSVMTILEISGIKCSTRSFQVEVELKQMMSLKPNDIFEKVLLAAALPPGNEGVVALEDFKSVPIGNIQVKITGNDDTMQPMDVQKEYDITHRVEDTAEGENTNNEIVAEEGGGLILPGPLETIVIQENNLEKNDIEEIDLSLDRLEGNGENGSNGDVVHIKERNEIYYTMYKNARRKAKIARDFALSSYLEAKQIKNTYRLDDIEDSDEDLGESDRMDQMEF